MQLWEKGLFGIVLFVHVACNVLLQLSAECLCMSKATLVWYKYTHNYIIIVLK